MKNLKILSAAALAAALSFSPGASRAYAMDLRHARAQKDLSPALQQSLQDKLSDVAEPYFAEQDEKKAKGQLYLDLQQKFEYLPTYGPHNHLVVSCKLGGVEYDPTKKGTAKGLATGKLKYLVFTYELDAGQWVSIAKPKWESQDLGVAGARQMRQNLARGEQHKAAMEKAAQTRAAASAAAAAAQKAANRSGQ
ncbi:hypothetical protein [Candidatus Binatus sp.]|uniref:hypothetical protein n=1 Tax=Candidatus Binatus sp. TaxID=2811406 RepID=UPI002F958A2C